MSGKHTVIITGASQGIGAGLVQGFLKEGYDFVATSRHAKRELAISDNLVLLDGDVSQKQAADDAAAVTCAGASEVSRFSCMKLPDVSGGFDYAGLTRDSRYRPRHVAFHQVKSVGALIASFRSSIPSPPVPLFTLRRTPRDAQRKTRGRVVRYSFIVGLFHSLGHAGSSRRTDSAISRKTRTLLL